MPFLLAVLLLALLLTTPATAEAVERYAAPDGDNTAACPSSDPCSFAQAVVFASGDDDVIVLPGDHDATSTGGNGDPITVRGAVGQPRPRIFRSDAGYALGLTSSGARARDLEIVTSGSASGVFFGGATAERITVRGTGTGNGCVLRSNAVLRDSLCSAQGTGSGVLIFGDGAASTVTLRNVTAHAAGDGSPVPPGDGIHTQPLDGGTLTVAATNVVAWGAQRDVFLDGDGTGESVIDVDHSNYDLIQEAGGCTSCAANPGAGNQTGAPIFRDLAADDFRQGTGSPTIDAGVSGDDTNRADADGLTRTIDGATDIGAYEQTIAPTVQTGDPSGVTETAVTLNATVTPHHEATTWRAELGTTTAYGAATPEGDLDPVGTAAPVTATFNGLVPGTTYHYRLVATNLRGTTLGPDRTFTTAGTAPGPGGQTTPGGQAPGGTAQPGGPGGVVIVEPTPFMGMTLAKRRIPVRRGIARVRVTCGAVLGSCSGKVRITTRRRGRTVTLGRRSFSGLGAGRTRTLRIRVLKAARGKRWRVRVVARARNEDGPLRTTSVRTRLVPRR